MTCRTCNGLGRRSLPNPAWTPKTPKEARGLTTGVHGRPLVVCEPCAGSGEAPA